MKRKSLAVFIVCLLVMGGAGLSEAALTRVGEYVYDDTANQYWISDLSRFASQGYADQITAIKDLDLQPQEDEVGAWRMATVLDVANLMVQSYPDIWSWSNLFGPRYYAQTNDLECIQGRMDLGNQDGYRHYSFSIVQDIMLPFADVLITIAPYGEIFGQAQKNVDNGTENNLLGAWAVADVVTTPIPAAFWLLGSGFGCVWLTRRRKPNML